jgi:hypothetical protein
MENQHQHIKGYRDLNQAEIDVMNLVKAKAEEVGAVINQLRNQAEVSVDQRWLAIAQTDLQKGFMSLVRAVAQPSTF